MRRNETECHENSGRFCVAGLSLNATMESEYPERQSQDKRSCAIDRDRACDNPGAPCCFRPFRVPNWFDRTQLNSRRRTAILRSLFPIGMTRVTGVNDNEALRDAAGDRQFHRTACRLLGQNAAAAQERAWPPRRPTRTTSRSKRAEGRSWWRSIGHGPRLARTGFASSCKPDSSTKTGSFASFRALSPSLASTTSRRSMRSGIQADQRRFRHAQQ